MRATRSVCTVSLLEICVDASDLVEVFVQSAQPCFGSLHRAFEDFVTHVIFASSQCWNNNLGLTAAQIRLLARKSGRYESRAAKRYLG